MRVYMVVNPRAKRVGAQPDLPSSLQKVLGQNARVCCSRSEDDLPAMARQCREGRYEALGICGGDGTVHHTLSAFQAAYGEEPLPPILLLNGGTINTVSRSIGLHGRPEWLARRFVRAEKNGRLRLVARSTMRCGPRLCFIFGLGLVTNFQHAFYAGSRKGLPRAAGLALRSVGSSLVQGPFAARLFAPWRGTLTVDGRNLPHKAYTAVLAQTIENLALGFTPMYRALERPGSFHLIAACLPPAEVLLKLPRLFLGKPVGGAGTVDEVCREIRLDPDGAGEYAMDGDLYPLEAPLVLTAGPDLRFFQF